MLDFLATNWADLLLVLVGFSACIVYIWQGRDTRKVAATLVKEQIDSIERNVALLKNDAHLGNFSIYRSKPILIENHWEKHKHLLVKQVSHSEMETVQRFFDAAAQLESARTDIIKMLTKYWETEAQIFCYFTALQIVKQRRGKVIHECKNFIERYERNSIEKIQDNIVGVLTESLQNFVFVSGTTAYEKIRKLSYER